MFSKTPNSFAKLVTGQHFGPWIFIRHEKIFVEEHVLDFQTVVTNTLDNAAKLHTEPAAKGEWDSLNLEEGLGVEFESF
jgi:hypothetical protein